MIIIMIMMMDDGRWMIMMMMIVKRSVELSTSNIETNVNWIQELKLIGYAAYIH